MFSFRARKQAIYWLVRLNSPEMTKQEHAEFFGWLESSTVHQREFLKAEQAWLSGSLASEINRDKPIPRQYYSFPIAALLIFFISVWCYMSGDFQSHSSQKHYVSTPNTQSDIQLSDGSLVVLHKDTELQFSSDGDFRVAQLKRGEAYFNVTKDIERPFYVVTDNGSVRVLGTQFTVRRIGSDSQITVLEGSVSLIDTVEPTIVGLDEKPLVVLARNQQIQFSDALKGESPDRVNAQIEMAWKDGRVVLNGLPLRDVIEKINRHFNTPIVIKQKSLEAKQITGVISLRDPLKAANTLAQISGATVSQNKADNNIELWIKVSE